MLLASVGGLVVQAERDGRIHHDAVGAVAREPLARSPGEEGRLALGSRVEPQAVEVGGEHGGELEVDRNQPPAPLSLGRHGESPFHEVHTVEVEGAEFSSSDTGLGEHGVDGLLPWRLGCDRPFREESARPGGQACCDLILGPPQTSNVERP